MAKLTLFWTKTAIKQRDYIFEYWNKHNESTTYTQKLYYSITERVELLKTYPKIGKQTTFKNTRIISLGHYSILYQQVNLKIIITGFWDNRQDTKKLLDSITDK